MRSENPFEEEKDLAVAYRYRVWDLGGDVKLAARYDFFFCSVLSLPNACRRTRHDAVMLNKENKDEYVSIKSFMEWNPKGSTSLNWRSRLAQQVG